MNQQIVSPFEEGGQNPHHMSSRVHDLPTRGTRHTRNLKFSSFILGIGSILFFDEQYSTYDLPFWTLVKS